MKRNFNFKEYPYKFSEKFLMESSEELMGEWLKKKSLEESSETIQEESLEESWE